MAGRIFITGDKHGTYLPFFGLSRRGETDEDDVMIIAGDAGYVWTKDYMNGIRTLEQLFPGTIAFIDGNHENHELLNAMEEVSWMGSRAHRVGERVYHMMRGEIYSINDKNIFTFGGARSNDLDRREEGRSWWREEEPDEAQMERAEKLLMDNIDDIDYVITHETPLHVRPFIKRSKPVDDDYVLPHVLDGWYEKVSEGRRFLHWYFGHMHVDQVMDPRLRAIHNDILFLGEERKLLWT